MNWRCAASSLLLALSVQAAEPCREDGGSIPDVAVVPVVRGLDSPTHVANAGDGSGRLFVVEQRGVIRVVKGGKLLPRPFLDIRKRVKSGGELGLLSVAFHPGYRKNGRLFVNYTSGKGGLHTVVSEFKASGGAADPASERVVFTVPQPYSNHNGGQNAFGPDGLLYVGMGDGGSGDDPHDNGQRQDTLLGKMLRVDVDSGRPEVFARGLRNPWRFSFDPVAGRLLAGDVGQDHWEEIDVVEEGGNYGWRVMEGSRCNPGIARDCDKTGFIPPVHDYGREDGVSVTGGFVYRGAAVPELCGTYVFGDFGSGRIWGLRLDASGKKSAHRLINDSGMMISSFGVDEDHELYAADIRGALYRLGPKK